MCLNNWFEDCLDWCYQIVEKDRYADQKYLDLWPEQYPNLKIIKNKGANLATWNVSNYRIQKKNNQIFIDDNKLVFYHFANLIQISNSKFKTNLSRVLMPTSGIIKEDIYIPYLKHLSKHLSKRNYMLLHKKKIYHIGESVQSIKKIHKISLKNYKILFIGNLGYTPNIMACKEFIRNVF